jgi:hypothetical protein
VTEDVKAIIKAVKDLTSGGNRRSNNYTLLHFVEIFRGIFFLYYSEICLNQTFLGPTFVFGIDRLNSVLFKLWVRQVSL